MENTKGKDDIRRERNAGKGKERIEREVKDGKRN